MDKKFSSGCGCLLFLHGNMIWMPHFTNSKWKWKDEMYTISKFKFLKAYYVITKIYKYIKHKSKTHGFNLFFF